jgi:2-(1,2-epoxy-1,2-dihydrophenyl)acetyl-CoA isomerase
MTTEVKLERHGQALIVTFSRPGHANALTGEMAQQLFNALKPATTDHGIRAVLLKGEGGHFMNDLEMSTYAQDMAGATERTNQMFQPYNSAIRELQVMEKPVVAAVEGIVSGVGLSIALACDLVIAARNAQFSTGFAGHAMTPHGGASFFLTRKAGAARAFELLALNETFSAEDALRFNLVNAVVDDDKLQTEAIALIDRLLAGPTKAYGGIKRLVAKAFEQDINTQLSLEHTFWGGSVRSFDFREAIKAMAAKRPPKYTGT